MTHLPPQSIEAEQSVLGGLLLDINAWDRIADGLKEDDFYRKEHRIIYRAISALVSDGSPADVITVSEWLKKNNELANVGGLAFLASLANNTPGAANIGAYAKLVLSKSRSRRISALLSAAQEQFWSGNEEGAVENLITELMRDERTTNHTSVLHEAALHALEEIERRQQQGIIPGIPTGLKEMDAKIGGLHPSDLIIIGARPAMGKTSILLNLAWHAGVPVGIFTAEQPSIQLAQRALAMVGRVNGKTLRNASVDAEAWPQLSRAVALMKERPIYLYDQPRPTMSEVLHQARKWKREHIIGMIGVDYLQRLDEEGDSREERIENVVKGLKSLARELDVPVIALSSLNRELEKRPDRRPMMSDFRGSGAIESEADVAIGLYRDEVYHEKQSNKGVAELIFLKNRHGPIGYLECAWTEEFMLFEDL
jgi:replicative DNA helicase